VVIVASIIAPVRHLSESAAAAGGSLGKRSEGDRACLYGTKSVGSDEKDTSATLMKHWQLAATVE
jgi:hypothetical protein